MKDNNIDIGAKALEGDEYFTRLYCGSYTLVKNNQGKLFRCKGDIPEGYSKIENVYDKDGFLESEYWSLERI